MVQIVPLHQTNLENRPMRQNGANEFCSDEVWVDVESKMLSIIVLDHFWIV